MVLQEMCVRNAMGIPKTDPIPMLQSTPLAGRTGLTMCDVLHPERDGAVACDAHFLSVFPQLFRRSIGVYLPVYAASTVAVQRASVLKRPLHFLGKMLGGALRSSAFLTVYVAAAHRGAHPLSVLCFRIEESDKDLVLYLASVAKYCSRIPQNRASVHRTIQNCSMHFQGVCIPQNFSETAHACACDKPVYRDTCMCSGVPGQHVWGGKEGAHATEVPDGCVDPGAGDHAGEEVAPHGACAVLHLPRVHRELWFPVGASHRLCLLSTDK